MVKVEMRLRMMDLYQNKRAATTRGYNESNCHRKKRRCVKNILRGIVWHFYLLPIFFFFFYLKGIIISSRKTVSN